MVPSLQKSCPGGGDVFPNCPFPKFGESWVKV